MATTDSSNDDAPAPDDQPAARMASVRAHPLLSAAQERSLFEFVESGRRALEHLAECLASGIRNRFQQVDQPTSAINVDEDVVASCCRNAIRHQALIQAGHIQFGESLSRALHDSLVGVLDAQERQFESTAVSWAEQICDQEAIQAAVPEEFWEMTDEWQLVAQRENALQRIIEHHQPVAISVAQAKMRGPDELEELVQEAALLLRHAAERFDPKVGVRFGSYARTILWNGVRRKLHEAKGLNRYTAEQVSAFERTQGQLGHQLGRPARCDEVHALLGHSPETGREIENVRRLLLMERSSSPIDATLEKGHDGRDEANQLERDELKQVLVSAFSRLSWLQKRVVVGHEIRRLSFRTLAKRFKKSPRTLSDLHKAAIELLARRIDPNWEQPKPR